MYYIFSTASVTTFWFFHSWLLTGETLTFPLYKAEGRTGACLQGLVSITSPDPSLPVPCGWSTYKQDSEDPFCSHMITFRWIGRALFRCKSKSKSKVTGKTKLNVVADDFIMGCALSSPKICSSLNPEDFRM